MLREEAGGGAHVRVAGCGGAAAEGVAEEGGDEVGEHGGGGARDVRGDAARSQRAGQGGLPGDDEATVAGDGCRLAGG